MRNRAVGAVLKGVRTLLDVGTSTGLSDGQLLERFLLQGDDAAEAAFRALVDRHGPMVLRACRGVLHDADDAEDAFQATFLVLARKAGTIRKGDSVASWLFGVARRVAVRADAQRKRRAVHEAQAGAMAGADAGSSDRPAEPMPEVQEEVDRLPERYRAPVVLCYLEGLTQEEAAIRLRLPASTVRVRLMRARTRLRDRLTRRGLAPAALAALSTAGRAEAAVPAPLVDETIGAATRFAAGRAAGVSAPVAALVQGVFRAMFLAKLKSAAALLAALLLVSTLMISTLAGPSLPGQDPPVAKDPVAAPAAEKTRPETQGVLEVTVATVQTIAAGDRRSNQVGRIVAYGSVDVYARTSGYLKHVNVDIGQLVKYGDVLAEVYDPELAIAADKARAEVGRARAPRESPGRNAGVSSRDGRGDHQGPGLGPGAGRGRGQGSNPEEGTRSHAEPRRERRGLPGRGRPWRIDMRQPRPVRPRRGRNWMSPGPLRSRRERRSRRPRPTWTRPRTTSRSPRPECIARRSSWYTRGSPLPTTVS